MGNKFTRNTMKITAIYNGFKDGTLVVDRTYQRKTVWGVKDNIRLIETILLKLIIPEIFLWDFDTDPNNGQTITHIVDGQQRINAIFDFIAGKYKLQKKYLTDNEIIDRYGDKCFEDLDDNTKKSIWSYEMSIIYLDKDFSIEEVRKMFYRLNLTDYNLNEQEKRNSLNSKFGAISEELANEEFWDEYKIFSPRDVRRMQDIEYCSSILILAREGIIDQTKNERLDQIYKEFCEDYKDAESDVQKVHEAMKLIEKLTKREINGFVNKKIQMYTMFSVMFDFVENSIDVSESVIQMFSAFENCYTIFKNEYDLQGETEAERKILEYLKKYKLASSEGVNKLSNRMIRFEVLKKVLLQFDSIQAKDFELIRQRMEELTE
ncbi:MAG: DUF262 domain-containing protein [Butyribacter sp.]|nr:DUF262 domain-containing protein [Lachnoclostridium sp.]MDY3853944.1 DUF262 domain-containing protein [Butyribacter sp.]